MHAFLPALLLLLRAGPAPQDATPAPAVEGQAAPAPTGDHRGEVRFEGALDGVQDAQDFAETPGYRRMLEILTRYGPEELRTKATRDLDFKAAVLAPEAWRGEIVHVRGLLAGLSAERLNTPIGEHVDAYRAVLIQPDGSAGVVVDFLAPPPKLVIQRDVVDVEGVFYRTVRYEPKRGTTRDAPYLIARDIRALDTAALPRRTLFDTMGLALIGAAGAFLVIRILLTLRKKPRHHVSDASEAIRQRARFAQASNRTAKP